MSQSATRLANGSLPRVSAIEVRSVLPSWILAPSANPFHEGRSSFKTRFTRATKAGRWR